MNRAALGLTLVLAASRTFAVGDTSCHIHPPGSTPQQPVGTIGPFDSVQACEQERARRFGSEGYCHCSADFTPDWRRLEPVPPSPVDIPLL